MLRGSAALPGLTTLIRAPDEGFDLVFSSLCPALNNPDSILRMAPYSKRNCAYISSVLHEDKMEIDAWKGSNRTYRSKA